MSRHPRTMNTLLLLLAVGALAGCSDNKAAQLRLEEAEKAQKQLQEQQAKLQAQLTQITEESEKAKQQATATEERAVVLRDTLGKASAEVQKLTKERDSAQAALE